MLVLAGAALTFVVLCALIGVVLAKRTGLLGSADPDRPPVALIAANDVGDAPFMPSVVVAPIEIAGTVASDMASFTAQLPRSAGRGARLVAGTQRGLYGSVGDAAVCDVPAIANFLDAYPDRSASWARAIGIEQQKVPYYLNTLTPVVLNSDTWVTLSLFSGGHTESVQAVLEAGNALLVDEIGVPRVHCASGNPLLPPANIDLSSMEPTGDKWPHFSPNEVLAVAYTGPGPSAPAVSVFELRDVRTGDVIERIPGRTIAIGEDPAGWVPNLAAMNVPPSHK
ncbi:DUF6777 domain-containing protein [Mycolicibacterium diernhoferi]|uniref:DUF6777 domain-containing protein n=1 Tax=Mycolicibacterium diernhoferi TaxID=1801 RepID=UPI0010420125|nr:DUF6777 domain-containing protein [Mycolicibacterium diernhoferi]QYL21763.1 hypothetical protein K0O62_22660 [Mycolicibacterium diernhoferi]